MKISLANMEKIIERCTKKEIDLIIHLGQFQDSYGVIKGINYTQVMESVGIAKSTFYKLLYSIEEKEIIEIDYTHEHSFWQIKIIDNVFASKSDYKKGYLKLNYSIFHKKEFLEMTKSEKLIVIHLIQINDFRKEKIKITFQRLMTWTNRSRRSVMKFIDTLKKVFNIIKKDNHVLFDCLFGFSTRMSSETDVRNTHLINYRLKKHKCQSDEKSIKDTNTVFKQYKIDTTNTIIDILDKSIKRIGELSASFINKLCQA